MLPHASQAQRHIDSYLDRRQGSAEPVRISRAG